MSETIFSKIIRKEIPADIVYETDEVLAFKDINPQAPVHILIIPKTFIRSPYEVDDANCSIAGKLIAVASHIAKEMKLESYRLVMNCGEEAGQSVFHLHLHLLAGRIMNWPPG